MCVCARYMDAERLEQAQQLLGYKFNDIELLRRALIHASVAEHRSCSNERLEFLGDAVLGLIVCERIFRDFPELLEGEMTKIKSTVVSRHTCAQITRELGLCDLLLTGKGMRTNKSLPQSLSAAVLESVIGAIYIDAGMDAARNFLEPLVGPIIDRAHACGHQQNFKSVLQHHAQQALAETPMYIVMDEQGPDHAKCFEIAVEIGARRFPSRWGQSKKQAEQCAALAALTELGVTTENELGEVVVNHELNGTK